MTVRILGDRIDSIGDLRPEPDEWYVDGSGWPGARFIDTPVMPTPTCWSIRDTLAAVSQGVTTVIGSRDGGSGRRSGLLRRSTRRRWRQRGLVRGMPPSGSP
jgi:hypothetical protein